MQRDLADELIGIRRALPLAIGMSVRFGAEPGDGLEAVVPEDPSWRIAARPDDTGWRLAQVHVLPSPLPAQREDLGPVATADAPAAIAAHFSRRQLLVRNAACGTPLDGRAGGGAPRLEP